MKKRGMIAVFILVILAGCGKSGVYKYVSFDNKEYSPLSKPAAITFQKDSYYISRGYRKIGKLGVYQLTAVCYEECKNYSYSKNIYQHMADEAAKKGAEVVQITMKSQMHKKKVGNRQKCVEYTYDTRKYWVCYGKRSDGTKIMVEKTEKVERCLKYQDIYGHEYTRWTFGFLWRKS